jgi:hypothetical protein
MTNRKNPEVDEWLDARDPESAEPMRLARRIILESDERITETIKWSTPTFMYKGNILSFSPTKQGVGLMFHKGSEIPGDHPLMAGNSYLVRTMRFAETSEVEAALDDIQRAVVAWCEWRDAVG